MGAVLGDVKGPRVSRLVFFGVAIAVALAFLRVGQRLELGTTLGPPPPPAPCLLSAPTGFVLLDRVDSLESCGARLEAVYLQGGQPVAGAYGGLRLFADAQGIDTALEHGPRETLITPAMRIDVDATLRELMARRDQRLALQISVVRPPEE